MFAGVQRGDDAVEGDAELDMVSLGLEEGTMEVTEAFLRWFGTKWRTRKGGKAEDDDAELQPTAAAAASTSDSKYARAKR